MAASTQVQDLQRSNDERKKDLAELTAQLEETQQALADAEELKVQMREVLQELAGAALTLLSFPCRMTCSMLLAQ
jgi:DNA repair exonuclease SbcCD ATPase subunit